jgi:PAS domain S-box-containing protein
MSTLRRKTLIIVGVTLIALIVPLYALTRAVLLQSFADLETKEITENMQRATGAISENLNDLSLGLADWAYWNDTYAFARDKNQNYIASNLMDSTFVNLRLSRMVFVNASAAIVYDKAFDLARQQAVTASSFAPYLTSDSFFTHLDKHDSRKGIVILPEAAMLVAVRPILDSYQQGDVHGTLIWGRLLDDAEVVRMSRIARLSLRLYPLSDTSLPAQVQQILPKLMSGEQQVIQPLDDANLSGYVLLDDIYGKPNLIVEVDQDRAIYQQGQKSIRYLLLIVLAVVVVASCVTLLLLEHQILARLTRLIASVRGIRADRNLTTRVPVTGRDELADLAASINSMLEALSDSQEQLQQVNKNLEVRIAERTDSLRRIKEHVEAILDNSADAILLARSDGVIRQTNHAFNALFGCYVDEMFGHSLNELFAPDQAQQLATALEAAAASKVPQRLELVARRNNGSTFDADLAVAPLNEPEREQAVVVCSLRDITERKRLEVDLRTALQKERQLNELKARFSSMVSHEFRNPLSVIQSLTSIMKKYRGRLSEDKQMEYLDQIRSQVSHLVSLLDDVLAISRAEAIKEEFAPVPSDLQALCRALVEEMRLNTPPTHQLAFSNDAHLPIFPFDPALMRRIITNLLSNAIKYSPEGGTVSLELCSEDGRALIRVRDQGIGIPKDDLPHLFETFHRASNVGAISGTGLGLAIVKQAVDQHGGSVMVESSEGAGTTFTVCLPLSSGVSQTVLA